MAEPLQGNTSRVERAEIPLLNRRNILQTGLGVAASVLPLVGVGEAVAALDPADPTGIPGPGEKTAADYATSEAMTRLSTYISRARDRGLPDYVVERTKWHILDTFAAMVSGSQLPAGQASIQFARAYGGKPVSTVIGAMTVCGPIEAAMLNGTMGHADETDDVGRGPWHPGCNVVPAALALGEQFKVSGSHFLRACTLGYDVGSRVETAAGVKIDYRTPTNSLGGVFGATAAAACVSDLNEQQTRWALSYAAQQCSGIDSFRRDIEHIEKGFMNGGMGARNGVTAVLLVLAGFNAVNDVFSGQAGFFAAYAATAKPELIADRLGEYYDVVNGFFKHWPVGAPVEPALDALQELLKRRPIDASQVREIVVRHTPNSITDNAGSPDINVQHAVALMLVDKKLTFKSIHDRDRLRDPQIVRLRSITREVAPPPRTSGDGGDAVAQVPVIQITLADGTRLMQGPAPGVIGSSTNPYSREWVVAKARSLMEPVLGQSHTGELIERVLGIDDVKSILELRPLLQAKIGPSRLSDWPADGGERA